MVRPITDCGLLIFAKAPIPGNVKTRMQPYLNEVQSALLHQNLVEHSLTVCSDTNWSKRELWIGGQHHWWKQLQKQYPVLLRQQSGGDLGARMYHAVETSFSEDSTLTLLNKTETQSVIVIGTDCPHIDSDYLLSAASALANYDVVLGPANDGGYVLIGLNKKDRERHQAIFSGIEWSTDQVLSQTRNRLSEQGLSWCELEPLSDIDRPEDLSLLEKYFPHLLNKVLGEY